MAEPLTSNEEMVNEAIKKQEELVKAKLKDVLGGKFVSKKRSEKAPYLKTIDHSFSGD
jgi:hypothetical protein